MGLITQTNESLKKLSLKLDFLTEAALRVKERDVGIEYSDYVVGLGMLLEDVSVELAQINSNLEKELSA